MQNDGFRLVSDLCKLLVLIAVVSSGGFLRFSSFVMTSPRATTYLKSSFLGLLGKKFEIAKIRDQPETVVLHKLSRALSRFRDHVERCGFCCSYLRNLDNRMKR